ncbi:MAG: C-GCAxxG-C-C family protein [Methanoregula sp.]|nr:C-GCAxxG-C-C family protein [Methanoregula sp.]
MTVTRADDAAANFTNGFSCSQAVCLAFAEDFGIDRETALKLSCAFGGGMAHSGNICGAVTGALMVIGMKYGRNRLDDLAAKEKTYEITKAFMKEFLRRNHSLNCTDLIGHNLSDPNALALAREKKLFHTKCVMFVRDAGEILETVL